MKYHYDVTGPDSNVIRKAFLYCLIEAAKKTNKEFTLALNSKEQLDANTMIEALGKSICKELKKSNSFTLYGVKITLVTKKIASKAINSLLLTIHPSTDYINDLLNSGHFSDSVYIPWTPKELNDYTQNYQSTLLQP
jgi:hypothetical protein